MACQTPLPRRVSLRISFLVTGLITLLAGCDRSEPYVIGVVLDPDGVRAVSMAAADINAHGGIHGHDIHLRIMSNAGSTIAKTALEVAEQLAKDPVILAVVGHTSSNASLAASQVYKAEHVTQIAPTSTSPAYAGSRYSFRLVASDIHQGRYLAELLLAAADSGRTVAMAFVNDDYGRPLSGIVRKRLRERGVAMVYDAAYEENGPAAAASDVTAALLHAHPDVLLWIGRAPEFGKLQPAIGNALPGIHVIASDGFDLPRLAADPARRYEGVEYVRLVDARRADTALASFRRRYVGLGYGEPTDQAILSHDAVTLIARAIAEAGPHREAIRDWVAQVGRGTPPFAGLGGAVAFDSLGNRAPQYFLERVHAAEAP